MVAPCIALDDLHFYCEDGRLPCTPPCNATKAGASGESAKSGASSAVWDSISKMLLRNEEAIRDLIDVKAHDGGSGNVEGVGEGGAGQECGHGSCGDESCGDGSCGDGNGYEDNSGDDVRERASWATPSASLSAQRRRYLSSTREEEEGQEGELWFTPCVETRRLVAEEEDDDNDDDDDDDDDDDWFTPQARRNRATSAAACAQTSRVDKGMVVRAIFVHAKENNWRGVVALLPSIANVDVRDPDGSGNTLL